MSKPSKNQSNRTRSSARGIDKQDHPDGTQQTTAVEAYHETSGPFPSGSELQYHESVLPGAAERIYQFTEREQQFRHEETSLTNAINRKIVEGNIRAQDSNIRTQDASIKEIKRGQWLAFVVILVVLASVVGLAVIGREITSSVLGVGGIAGVAWAFIKVRKQQ